MIAVYQTRKYITLFDRYFCHLYFTLANGTTIDTNRVNDDDEEKGYDDNDDDDNANDKW